MATALTSLLTGRKPQAKLAMTGEVTLSGDVMPIGGLKEKSLAAHRAGITTVIIPQENEKDLVEVPDEVRKELKFIPVATVHDAIEHALQPATRQVKRPAAKSNKKARST